MKLDLSECEIRTPEGDELIALYRELQEIFPADQLVFDQIIREGKRFYTWTPYTLYRGREFVSNVALVPIRVWLEGRIIELAGVASVATAPQYRLQGAAARLLRHVLEITDRQGKPCILFTGTPAVYQNVGFQLVQQHYWASPVERLDFPDHAVERQWIDQLTREQLQEIARVYADRYANYDGKVARDAEYWDLYEMLFNPYSKPRMLLCRRGGELVGFSRVELEQDRLLCAELCADESDEEAGRAMLSCIGRYASESGVGLVVLALPPGHFALRLMAAQGGPLAAEPPGAQREHFMARAASGGALGPLATLQWSLADKF
jgi:predicted N-acetyltransferase YhbS